jgi:signal peptidase II
MTTGHDRHGGDELDDAAIGLARSVEGDRHEPGAGAGEPRWILFAALAAAIIVADQLTKAWIVANVDPARPTHIVGDSLRLVVSHNTGALFGLFRDQAPLFALLSVGVIGLIAWYHGRTGRSTYMTIALGLLLGGAIGNFVDRFRLGYVVDFVDAGVGNLRWYTFNVADSAISGALLLLLAVAIWPSLASRWEPPSRPGVDA